MAVEFSEKDSFLIVRITDKLDSLNAKAVHSEIEEKLKTSGRDVVFDFEALEYISSAGLQVLISCAKNRKTIGKKVLIYKPCEMVDNIINVTGFYAFLEKTEKI